MRTQLAGPLLISPVAHGDVRGFFTETYRRDAYAAIGVGDEFVQDNHSRSSRGVVRGLHFQLPPGQAKLIRCARGEIFDVVVDIRPDSPTFGSWEGHVLSDENHRQLYCPVGFAHGFCVTSDVADVTYKCSNYYAPEIERGIRFDDPAIGIDWPPGELLPSARDAQAPTLAEIAGELPFRFSGG